MEKLGWEVRSGRKDISYKKMGRIPKKEGNFFSSTDDLFTFRLLSTDGFRFSCR